MRFSRKDDPWITFYDGGEDGGDGGSGEGGDDGAGGGDAPVTFAADNFQAALPEELRGHESFAKTPNLEALARSYINGQKLIGMDPANTWSLPAADDAEALTGVLRKLGAPEGPDGYKLTVPDGTPEFLAPDQGLGKGYLETSAKLGILPQQADGLYQWFAGALAEVSTDTATKSQEAHDANVAAITKEWGETDSAGFKQNIAMAEFAIDKLGGEDLRGAINKAGLGTNPVVLKAFRQVGALLAEDGTGGGRDAGGAPSFGQSMTPDQARSRGEELRKQSVNETNPAERRRLAEEAQRFYHMANKSVISAG